MIADDPVLRRLTHLPWGLAGSAVVLVVGGGLGWWERGGVGVAGVVAGVLLVVVSYTLSSFVIAIADSIRPALILPFGLATYVVKFTAFGLVMARVSSAGWDGLPPMGLAIAATAVIWSAAQILWLVRTQHPYRPISTVTGDDGTSDTTVDDPDGAVRDSDGDAGGGVRPPRDAGR